MARKRVVTRTIKGTEVSVLGINTETTEPETVTYVIPGNFQRAENEKAVYDYKKLLKAVKERYDTETFSNVKVVDAKNVDKLYGMFEDEFIAKAMEMDPKTRKFYDDDTETDTETETGEEA